MDGYSRFDLQRIQRTLSKNLKFIRVTGGTFAWAGLYAFVLFLWWKFDKSPPDSFLLILLVILSVVGIILLIFTLEYPLKWMRARREEFGQVMVAYFSFIESLPPELRVGEKHTELWEKLRILKGGLEDVEKQLENTEEHFGNWKT